VTDAGAQQRLTTDVAEDAAQAVFVYKDVEHFIDAAKAIAAGADPAEAMHTKYLDRASPGLRKFIEKYDLTADRLLKAMEKHPGEYARLDETLKLLKTQELFFRKTYAELKKVIPDAVFPPTYFLVAGYRGIGSGSIEGPLVSIEKETAESIEADLDASLVHEMVHMQQLAAVGEAYFAIFSGEERTLLALSIREGAATFFAELVAGGSKHKNLARDYLLAHEEELWEAFREDMLGHETGDWLWQRPANPEQPQDVGYAMGARIVETFYNNARDKRQAAREIMAITDYPAFLTKSGYADAAPLLGDPPTDDAVRAVADAFRARRSALFAEGNATLEDIKALNENPLSELDIVELTPTQIAMLHGVGVFQGVPMETENELKDQAAERLETFTDEPGVQGAAARILLLELQGGATPTGHPEYELQTELLKRALAHPKLDEAVREHDVALISAISSLGRIRAWNDSKEGILALRRFFGEDMPPRLAMDFSDFWEMLDYILDAENEHDRAHRQDIRATLVKRARTALAAGEDVFAAREREFLEGTIARLEGAAARGQLLGHEAPPLDFIWSNDKSLASLAALRGNVVILDFWATWCGPCVESIPNVRELQIRYADYPVKIIGVTSVQGTHVPKNGDPLNTKGDQEREFALMSEYIEDQEITWLIAFSRQPVYNPDYGVRGIPHVVIIDAGGKVRFNDLHPADPLPEHVAKIDALLREAKLPSPPPLEIDEAGDSQPR
jgi:thiol-disulfide isomerase/thioredoxin